MGECYDYGASTCATSEGFARATFPNTHTKVSRGELLDDFGVDAVGE
jgi:hypothetical protein